MNKENNNQNNLHLITIYQNYLHALEEKKEHGDRYGDTDEIIKMYEEKLKKIHVKRKSIK